MLIVSDTKINHTSLNDALLSQKEHDMGTYFLKHEKISYTNILS